MAYCGPRGLPHSFFLGGPHAWTQDDRDKALAWQELDRQSCPSCGTRAEEWNPEHGGHPRAYAAEHTSCDGCAAIDRAHDSKDFEGLRGHKIRLRARTPDELAEIPLWGARRR